MAIIEGYSIEFIKCQAVLVMVRLNKQESNLIFSKRSFWSLTYTFLEIYFFLCTYIKVYSFSVNIYKNVLIDVFIYVYVHI